nr:unnamed protein product [Callosobruchus chinensis]
MTYLQYSNTMEDEPGISERINKNTNFYIGLLLAVCSSLFIGTSFIIKKISLTRLSRIGALRAGAGGFGYLKDWFWWLGISAMGFGELLNFAAYGFAPASVVTPLGALSVLVSAVLASKFLNEKLTILGKLGCLLCILGATIIVIHAPKEEPLENFNLFLSRLQEPAFARYMICIVVLCCAILCYLGPRYGSRYVFIYITLCSAIGGITVMACKAIGLALKSYSVSSLLSYPTFWLLSTILLTMCLCVCVQISYLNRTLDLFNASVVTPTYYVFFTSFVIAESVVLFREWERMTPGDMAGALCGFVVTIVAVFVLSTFKEGQQQQRHFGANTYFPVKS